MLASLNLRKTLSRLIQKMKLQQPQLLNQLQLLLCRTIDYALLIELTSGSAMNRKTNLDSMTKDQIQVVTKTIVEDEVLLQCAHTEEA